MYFSKTIDLFKLYIPLCCKSVFLFFKFSVFKLWQCCSYNLFRFVHLVRVKKSYCISITALFLATDLSLWHIHTHLYTNGIGCHEKCHRSSGAIWGSVSCMRILRHCSRLVISWLKYLFQSPQIWLEKSWLHLKSISFFVSTDMARTHPHLYSEKYPQWQMLERRGPLS